MAKQGKPKEVMFKIQHSPGALGLSDFTHLKGISVTVRKQPFQHILYHYRLAYSGWQYVQVIQAGESFFGLSQGLQNALFACGGVPQQHRTDSLSAAYRNTGGRNPQLTQMYAAICDHYRVQPTRNNPGVAHENGSIVRFVLVEVAKKPCKTGLPEDNPSWVEFALEISSG